MSDIGLETLSTKGALGYRCRRFLYNRALRFVAVISPTNIAAATLEGYR
jgi:hypothetical protein